LEETSLRLKLRLLALSSQLFGLRLLCRCETSEVLVIPTVLLGREGGRVIKVMRKHLAYAGAGLVVTTRLGAVERGCALVDGICDGALTWDATHAGAGGEVRSRQAQTTNDSAGPNYPGLIGPVFIGVTARGLHFFLCYSP